MREHPCGQGGQAQRFFAADLDRFVLSPTYSVWTLCATLTATLLCGIATVSSAERIIEVDGPDHCAEELGLQQAIDGLAAEGGGTLFLKDVSKEKNASVKVGRRALVMKKNVRLAGHPSRSPYGMTLWGVDTPGHPYRVENSPLILITGQGAGSRVDNLHFDGTRNRHDCAAVRVGAGADDVLVENCHVEDFVRFAVRGHKCSRLRIMKVRAQMHWSAEYELRKNKKGSCAIHLVRVRDSEVSGCRISAPAYYDAGAPANDERIRARRLDGVAACDLIGSYGGENNVFAGNILHDANTAGIWLSFAHPDSNAMETNAQVKNNRIFRFRQAGIDCCGARNVTLVGNQVSDTEVNGIWLYNVHGGEVRGNRIDTTGHVPSSYSLGALTFADTTNGITVRDNVIDGKGNSYAVYFHRFPRRPDRVATNNVITGNTLLAGEEGFVGGAVEGNRVEDNQQRPQTVSGQTRKSPESENEK
jgi:parallel beta-helix repeat protein